MRSREEKDKMYAEKQEKYLSLLHDETSLALGCTEPGAVALAAAYAAAVLEEEVQKIKIIFIKDSAKHNILFFLFVYIKFSLKITTC